MSSMITLNLMFLNSESSRIWAYLLLIVCLAISAAVAYLISRVTELGIIVSGVAGGFFLAFLMNYLIFWRIDSSPSWLFLNCLIVYFCVLGGILGYEFKDIIVILATSLIGSYITVRSISVIFGGFVNEFEINTWMKTGAMPTVPLSMYFYLILIFALFAVGAFFQMKWRPHRLAYIVGDQKIVNAIEKANNFEI